VLALLREHGLGHLTDRLGSKLAEMGVLQAEVMDG
jgi:hypothetical protein